MDGFIYARHRAALPQAGRQMGQPLLDDDFYEFDEKNFCVLGRRTHRKYQLGDKITIQVARADLIKKQLDFALVDKNNPPGTHRIDKAPITEASRFAPSKKESKMERQREEYEGGYASRRQKRGKRGNTSKREMRAQKREGKRSKRRR
ncbi:MAG: hypothetical protein IIT60_01325 [Muribaculaceae bacterium]|nr:hypothetical protein [Muribaculaceae bacterium]